MRLILKTLEKAIPNFKKTCINTNSLNYQGRLINKEKKKMEQKIDASEKLSRMTSGPENFGWAPLAWAYTED